MQGNRRSDTRPELALRAALRRRGLRYRLHVAPESDLKCRADLLFRRARVAVFVDGCFWHGCPEHGTQPTTNARYWGPKIERNMKRDRFNTHALEARGWAVVRVWEHDDPEAAAARVIEVLRAHEVGASGRPNTAGPAE